MLQRLIVFLNLLLGGVHVNVFLPGTAWIWSYEFACNDTWSWYQLVKELVDQLTGHGRKYVLRFTHKCFHHKRIRGEYKRQWKTLLFFRTNTVIYWLHTVACVIPPFFPHQIFHSMQFTKEQFTTLNRYFTINFGQVYLFCVKALLITFASRPSPTHDFVTSAFLHGVAFQRCIVSQITEPKERKSERRDEIRDSDMRTTRSVTGRWVSIVHRSTVTDTFRSLVGSF